ncbi:MAG TPA: NAD(P)/FAD-dependent oxidoreductase [Pyrinomonadaceae bacterium]|nr:NAD(P)/FAD-dependent oxidoreductase [Pyrinomonadaceae bacterium]
MSEHGEKQVVIIGGGPAGLTAAYELCKAGVPSVVLERDAVVGGLSRTVDYKGYLFDIGGHRFYTKVRAVEDVWREVLPGPEFLRRKRLSRIYYDKKFFYYPLRLASTLRNLGLVNSALILLSYLRAQFRPERDVKTFEQWVTNRFGRRFYRTFFKTYTEKVWGVPCHEITAEWAAQRIKDLSLPAALKSLFTKRAKNKRGEIIKTLIEEFDYPARGPGMMWERMAKLVERQGSRVRVGAGVEKIHWTRGRVEGVEVLTEAGRETVRGSHFISSMPVRELVRKLAPAPTREVLDAAESLRYRDFLTVVLVVNRPEVFPDNWIYIHDPEVKMGRIQNFKNWSPQMVADPSKTCLGLEYFCFEGDGLWQSSDEELLALGRRELGRLGLVREGEVEDGTVLRVRKAYPVYDSTYREALKVVRRFLSDLPNLQLVGRNGMHKYNNQDHSMLTAMLAVKNILGARHDLWEVNTDQEYLEELHERGDAAAADLARLASTQPRVPERVGARAVTS